MKLKVTTRASSMYIMYLLLCVLIGAVRCSTPTIGDYLSMPVLEWYPAGQPPGKSCIQIYENINARYSWSDNYLCSSDHDLSAWYWTDNGVIRYDMDCVQWYEPLDPSWSDNWLCIPKDDRYNYSFSNDGPVVGARCTQIYETADPNSWGDNYFCVLNPNWILYSGSDAGPAVVVHEGVPYTFFVRQYFILYVNNLLDSSLDTYSPMVVPHVASSGSLAAVSFQGSLYLFFHNIANDKDTYYVMFNEGVWSRSMRIPYVYSPYGVSAVVYGSLLYLIYNGIQAPTLWQAWQIPSAQSGYLSYVTTDGRTWSQPYVGIHQDVEYAPSCVVHTNRITASMKLRCAYKHTYTSYSFFIALDYVGPGWSAKLDLVPSPWVVVHVCGSPYLIDYKGTTNILYTTCSPTATGPSGQIHTANFWAESTSIVRSGCASTCATGLYPTGVIIHNSTSGIDTAYVLYLDTNNNIVATHKVVGNEIYIDLVYGMSPPIIATPSTYTNLINVVMTADPQYPWCDDDSYRSECRLGDGGDSRSSDSGKASKFSYNLIKSQYSSINYLRSAIAQNLRQQVFGTVINGDLTASADGWELQTFEFSLFPILNGDVYYGLGNHDYSNYACDEFFSGFSPTACSTKMVGYGQRMSLNSRVTNFDFKYNTLTATYTGSLAYGFFVGSWYFVQLQNFPAYEVHLSAFFYDYYMKQSISWLGDRFKEARRDGYKIVINMHDYGDTQPSSNAWTSTTLGSFDSLVVANTDVVCAVFAGHFHGAWGKTSSIGTIPVFNTGSAMYQTYSLLTLDPVSKTMTVAGILNDRVGSDSKPTYVGSSYGFGTYPC